jgi:hypothetical protein
VIPAGTDPKYQEWLRRARDLQARALSPAIWFKALVAVGQVAALVVLFVRSCS